MSQSKGYKPVRIIYSISHVGDEDVSQILQAALDGGTTEIDTAHLYAQSEEKIGRSALREQLSINTKAPGVFPGSMKKESILAGVSQSLRDLQVQHVETY